MLRRTILAGAAAAALVGAPGVAAADPNEPIYEPQDVEATRTFVRYVGMQDGKYVYSLTDGQPQPLNYRTARGESSWAAQLTLTYQF